MKTEITGVYLDHEDNEEVFNGVLLEHEKWKDIGYGRAPDVVRRYPDGSERWYYLTVAGGLDDTGPFEVVTDGPAQGEKVYAYYE